MQCFSILSKTLLIFLACCCCSFSAVPTASSSTKEVSPIKTKRQLRQEKRQQKKYLRIQKHLEKAKKNHAVLNFLGFSLIAGAPLFLFLGGLTIVAIFGLFGATVNLLLGIVLGISIAIAVAGTILCILGLIGHKQAEKPKIGFAIAGLIMVGIPALIGLVALFVAFGRFAGFIA